MVFLDTLVMIGAWVIGPLIGASFLHLSRPGRWLEHRWQDLAAVLQQKIDAVGAHITQAQAALIGKYLSSLGKLNDIVALKEEVEAQL